MIKVLTIEREYGSGAADDRPESGGAAGLEIVGPGADRRNRPPAGVRQATCGAARGSEGIPLHYRLFKAFLRGSFEGSLNAPQMKIADAEGIRRVTENWSERAAAEGNAVIVGRGSAYYLHERPDAFHVFIYAPFEEKVRRLQQRGQEPGGGH